MISRIWHGWTTPADADAYQHLLLSTIVPAITSRRLPGYHGMRVDRRDAGGAGDLVEFVTTMYFDSVDAVVAFAGMPYERCVVPAAAQALLARYDAEAAHYRVLAQERPDSPAPADARLEQLTRLWSHARWADASLLDALHAAPEATDAWREYAHLLGAASVWLARLQEQTPHAAIWPALPPDGVVSLHADVHASYDAYLAGLDPAQLAEGVRYTNSAGRTFTTAVGDIIAHVMLHGQYHRGKVNLMLRTAGAAPAPADYVAFIRGAPTAATGASAS